ncbi:restriction endonuclease subunit S [Enterococcus sp. C81]|uniref:restriction endonuclease subunit S n=1 Tax=Enterococcus sp. C81 TaxID=3231338 RepID=UPI002DB92FB4|nr:restriction endonuclease subunit S [Enterococcus faecalis]
MCKLGRMASFSKGNGYSKADLIEEGHPLILYGRLYTKYETIIESVDTFAKLQDKSILSKGGEVIVPSSGESAEDISRASVVDVAGVVLGGDLNIIKTNSELNPTFLALTISNGSQQKEMSKRAQGKSIVHLHNSDLKEINLLYPKIEEQIYIGLFFKKLEDTINLHQRKLDQLKELKKAYLQVMFPEKDERVPKLRFADFEEEWELCKFSDILETHSTKKYLAEPNKNGEFEVIQQGDNPIIGYATGKAFLDYNKIVLFGDHTLSLYKPKRPFFVATDGIKILSGKNTIGKFLFTLLQRYMPNSQGYKRHFTILKNENIYYTSTDTEQLEIGDLFLRFDILTTYYQDRIINLKKLKKSYLQNMFI